MSADELGDQIRAFADDTTEDPDPVLNIALASKRSFGAATFDTTDKRIGICMTYLNGTSHITLSISHEAYAWT